MIKTTETAIKLLEALPEHEQERVIEVLRHLLQDSQDEARWDQLFNRSEKLMAAAREAKTTVAEGNATDMDYERL